MTESPPPARRPMRNRVTPLGDLIATGLRGTWTGNRGIRYEGAEAVRFNPGDLWVTDQRPQARPTRATTEVITPPASVAALRTGYRPHLDPGALSTG